MTIIPTDEDHPDFTRPSQFTAAPVIAGQFGVTGAGIPLGTFYTGGYESLMVRTSAQAAGVGYVYSLFWYDDQALTHQVGQTNLRTIAAIPVSAQVPNRGPWCEVTASCTAVAAHNATVVIIPRTGTPSGAGAFLDGLIHGGAAVSIAATTTLAQNAFGLTPGEACLTVGTNAVAWNAQVVGLDELSANVGVFGGMSSAGGGVQSQRFILPPYWTRLALFNGDGVARSFDFAVQAAL